jgi:hypothetical protein
MARMGLKRMMLEGMSKLPVTRPIQLAEASRAGETQQDEALACERRPSQVAGMSLNSGLAPRHVLVTGPIAEGVSKLKCDHSRR